MGEQGIPGTSVTVAPVSPGGTCAAGGVRITSATGTTFVCNGETGPQGATGPRGPTGATGSQGPAGQGVEVSAIGPGANCDAGGVSIESASGTSYVCNGIAGSGGGGSTAFGDGGIGNVTVSSNRNWRTNPPAAYTFNNLTINSGRTLTVPSGTVLRVAGTFRNNGTIVVEEGIRGARWSGTDNAFPVLRGNAMTIAQKGGGLAFPAETLRQMLHPGPYGGGNGRRGNGSPNNDSGAGGGSLVIRAADAFVNAGTIRARGGNGVQGDASSDDGGGGGAGGFIIIASGGPITNSGTIDVRAGNGAGSLDTDECGGGGGGGGVIHLLGPNASSTSGTFTVSGGSPGNTICNSSGGPAGGAMGGDGGAASDDGLAARAGSPGLVLRTQVSNPGPLF